MMNRSKTAAARLIAATLAVAACAASAAAQAKPPAKCGGADLVAKLEREHPEVHRKAAAAAAKIPNANAILWKVEKAGTPASYLFGTMHVSDPRIVTLPPEADTALKSARTIVLEIADLSPQSMGVAIAARPDLMVYTDGSSLTQKLTKQEFAVAKEVLAQAGLPEPLAAMMRPWFVYLTMALPACEMQRVQGGKPVLDQTLAERGKAQKIPVVGLETPLQQLEIVAGLPEKDQIALLKNALEFADQREDTLETMIRLYQKRQIGMIVPLSGALAELRGLKVTGMKTFMAEVVVKRNLGMRDKALPLLAKGGAFIAVGSLHLIGEEGLVALFRDKGYKVTAIE